MLDKNLVEDQQLDLVLHAQDTDQGKQPQVLLPSDVFLEEQRAEPGAVDRRVLPHREGALREGRRVDEEVRQKVHVGRLRGALAARVHWQLPEFHLPAL